MSFYANDPTTRAAGSIGGLTKASRYGPDELTGAARRGFMRRFYEQVDSDYSLPSEERERRARAAMRAHMRRVRLQGKRKAAQ